MCEPPEHYRSSSAEVLVQSATPTTCFVLWRHRSSMANAQNDAQVDELFVLRVPDQRLGQRLQAALSEEPGQEKLSVRLEFTGQFYS